MKKALRIFIPAAAAIVFMAATADAGMHESRIRALVDSEIKAWINNALVIAAIKEQNAKNASLTQDDIDRLDKQWRAETRAAHTPLINKVLSTALSKYLKRVKSEAKGLFTEIFVMDNRGLNVAQSDATSDY